MKSSSTRIVVEVCGGSVSAVYASGPDVTCTVVDWDELTLGEQPPVLAVRPLTSAPEEIKALVAAPYRHRSS